MKQLDVEVSEVYLGGTIYKVVDRSRCVFVNIAVLYFGLFRLHVSDCSNCIARCFYREGQDFPEDNSTFLCSYFHATFNTMGLSDFYVTLNLYHQLKSELNHDIIYFFIHFDWVSSEVITEINLEIYQTSGRF